MSSLRVDFLLFDQNSSTYGAPNLREQQAKTENIPEMNEVEIKI